MTPKLTTERLVLREIKGNDLFGFLELLSNPETMRLFGGPTLKNDLDNKDFVNRMRMEREQGICYFWTISLKIEREFIGFVRLMSYKSAYYDSSFSAMRENKFNPEFIKYFDRQHGWEIDYALLPNHRSKGIMKEALSAVMIFCESENLSPIYAKVNSVKNEPTVKVLRSQGFKDYMNQVNEGLLRKHGADKLFENGGLGMIYRWTSE